MSLGSKGDTDGSALRDDIDSLKRDMASLLAHLQSGAVDSTQRAADQITDSAQRAYRTVGANGTRSVAAVERQIEERPLVALLLAAGVGYLGGRLLSR